MIFNWVFEKFFTFFFLCVTSPIGHHHHEVSSFFPLNKYLFVLTNLTSSRTELCQFSGFKIYPGHGKRYVRMDNKVSSSSFFTMRLCKSLTLIITYRALSSSTQRTRRHSKEKWIHAKYNGLKSTGVYTRRAQHKKSKRRSQGGWWRCSETLLVLLWNKSVRRGPKSPKSVPHRGRPLWSECLDLMINQFSYKNPFLLLGRLRRGNKRKPPPQRKPPQPLLSPSQRLLPKLSPLLPKPSLPRREESKLAHPVVLN